ncbi:fasciclin domain-containing protein [Ilumatobacter fluminis]|uniref:Fasciclin domain-containing protein n=1 Tax=Ilumatobacter fluminis TaxID=467091 RepID=A0A4R7I2V3_9ACTN|nr:fasciclin domain-containing protein [Ilumatobacter fluminis]TDT17947.1 fasciclin domain-containing protein [Ilumatobacter fluminis]
MPAGETISDVASANGATFIPTYTDFAPMYAAAIEGPGPVTALMPDDDAFIGFSTTYPDLLEELRADFDLLDSVLSYHVIDGALTATEIMEATELPTLQGEAITVEVVGDAVVFNGGEGSVKIADLVATNGIVHILDGILLPPSVSADAS